MTLNKPKTAARVLVTLAAASVLGGCAMKGDVRALQDEIRGLSARQDSLLTELRAQQLSTQDTLRTQGDQMFNFRGDINRRLRALEDGLSQLLALAGANQAAISSMRQELAGLEAASTRRTPAVSTGGGNDELLVGADEQSADDLWDVADQAHQRGSLVSATVGFRDFLDQFPNHERAADAYYALGDILQQQGEPEDAIAEFEEVGTLFPTHELVEDSLFRIAVLQIQIDDEDAARDTLQRLINTYESGAIVEMAREMLEEIGG